MRPAQAVRPGDGPAGHDARGRRPRHPPRRLFTRHQVGREHRQAQDHEIAVCGMPLGSPARVLRVNQLRTAPESGSAFAQVIGLKEPGGD
ncbi:hypothetical protein G3I59_08805 [Amycolatopsis rubida]|uniref:Uncharacterized protein n=1 Tax=Amycolatopsis rubida TaxID=112413 RepID=A0ABX0BS46_9PSEU|nr:MULTISPECIES: hypothetical protein [Amycolatopsis]NEC55691.1 hypothetical protein [Amycolatopsis rubida]